MCQDNCTTKRRKFKQLTYKDRIKIEVLYNKEKRKFTEIGEILGFHRTTISREIKNGLVDVVDTEWKTRLEYSSDLAQKKNEENETAKGASLKIGKDIELANYIDKKIEEKFSPEVIAEKIKKSNEFKTKISYKTIYNYIKWKILNSTTKDLVYGEYKKKDENKKEEATKTKISKIGKTIHDRPKEIEKREEIGHWEMDLVEGLKGQREPYLLVLSERKTRKEIIELIPNKAAETIGKALDKIEKRLGIKMFRKVFKTITTDNGSEFRNWSIIEKSYRKNSPPRTTQYYADAYSSWQRGTNENINKMIRRFLPKGTSFKDLTEEKVKIIEKWINNYPRKILGFKTSEEFYQEELLVA